LILNAALQSATLTNSEHALIFSAGDLSAGHNVTLDADNDITLLAAQNTASQTSTNRSSSNSIGVGFALGGQSNGFTLNFAASRARGNADGNDETWRNSRVDAGNTLILKSGSDTTLKGATATGKQKSPPTSAATSPSKACKTAAPTPASKAAPASA